MKYTSPYQIAGILYTTVIILLIGCSSRLHLPDPVEAGWQGESVCEVIEETEKLRVLRCVFPPNVGHEKHYHAAHFGYTIKGSLFRIEDASGVREVKVPTGYDFSNDGAKAQNITDLKPGHSCCL